MKFCPECGTPHECNAEGESRTPPEVEIARINADRDVAVAKLTARMNREELGTAEAIAETEADAQVDTAEAEAEVIGAILAEGGGGEPEPATPPIMIDAPVDVSQEADPEELPPAEGSPAPEPERKTRSLGMW